ncbi:MAG: hypothetical protein ACYC5O_09100 [Anaerolineae bacterium]
MSSRRAWSIGTAAALAVAAAVFLWAGLHWTANFDSDEAIFGLMAKHILRGETPTYRYGLAYLGSLESLVAAPFIRVLGGGVVPLRLSAIPLYLCFLAMHSVLARRLWGTGVAVVSTLLLAVPARWVLEWLYRPMGFSTILPFGTAAMLLATWRPPTRSLRWARLAALGLVAGLALWSNPSTLLYFAVLAAVAWLGSAEWRYIRSTLVRLTRLGKVSLASILMPLAVLAGALLLLTAVFADGCDPGWTAAARIAKGALATLALCVVVAAAYVSRRRLALLVGGGIAGVGLAAGALPVWRAWAFFGSPPARAIMPSCPAGVPDRATLMFDTLLPALGGGFSASYLPDAVPGQALLWVLVVAIVLAAAATFAFRERAVVADLLRAAALPAERQAPAALLLLLALPVLLAVLGSNTMDLTSTRYLMISWHAGTVVLALFLVRSLASKRSVAALVVSVWVLQLVLVSYRSSYLTWERNRLTFEPERVSALGTYLHSQGVSGGYAGYWLAFALDYLWDERVTMAPFSGSDRYPAYGRYVENERVQAYVFWRGDIPEAGEDAESIVAALRRGDSGGPGYPGIVERVQQSVVLERKRVGNWDVWLLSGESAAVTE